MQLGSSIQAERFFSVRKCSCIKANAVYGTRLNLMGGETRSTQHPPPPELTAKHLEIKAAFTWRRPFHLGAIPSPMPPWQHPLGIFM